MKRSKSSVGFRVASFLALTISVSCGINSKTYAADFSKFVTRVPGVTNVNERQGQIQKRLRDSVSTGRLSFVKSQEFNKELDKIADLEASYRASHGNLSLWENLKLLFQLDNLSRKIEQSLTDRQVADLDISDRLDQIHKRIADGLLSHRLTVQESNDFKYDLDRISTAFEMCGGKTENLTDTQAFQLALDIDRLSNRMENTMHDRQIELGDIDKAQKELEEKIANGISKKKLTADEAAELKAEFKKIADKESRLKGFGRPLTSQETLALAIDLEKLSREFDLKVRDADVEQQDYIDRKEEIASKIAAGVVSGKLTLPEAYYLKDQLERIAGKEAEWRKDGGSLTKDERKSLLIDLEKLSISVERRLFDARFTWSGVSKTIADMQSRIDSGATSDRISDKEKKRLAKSLQSVKSTWDSIRNKESYPLKDSIFIVSSLDELRRNLAESLTDRDMEVPKYDQRKSAVDRRIATGVTSGRLTAFEGQKLLDEFDLITEKEALYRSSNGKMTDRERLSMALLIERLSARVERAIHEGSRVNPSFDQMKQQIKDDIEEGIIAGKLTEEEAQRLKNELTRVSEMERGYRGTSMDISATQALTVAQNLNTLTELVNTEIADMEVALPDVEKRRKELVQRIGEGIASGKLEKKEADLLRGELTKIENLEKGYTASGGMSIGEAAVIAYKLERLGNQIEQRMHQEKISLPTVANLHDQIDQRLARSVASGQLDIENIKEFKKELEDIARMEMGFRYTGDGLSYPETLMLTKRFNNLNQKLDKAVAGKSSDFDGIDDRLDKTGKRIAEGVLKRKLSASNADSLKQELDRIKNAKVAFAHSEGGYSLEETETLVRDIDRLNAEIGLRLKGQKFAWSDIDRRQNSLEVRLKQAIRAGKIKGSDAQLLTQQLDKIKRAKAAFTMSDGNLNFFERVSLGEALDRFDQLMKRTTK